MNDGYTVWCMCYNPVWLAQNDGEPDMQLIDPTDLPTARKHAARLAMMAPSAVFQVRDGLGDVVGPETTGKPRRALGSRGL